MLIDNYINEVEECEESFKRTLCFFPLSALMVCIYRQHTLTYSLFSIFGQFNKMKRNRYSDITLVANWD